MNTSILKVQISKYSFDKNDNLYEGVESGQPIPLIDVAQQIVAAIDKLSAYNRKLLVRGIQSGKHKTTREQLLVKILEKGGELEDTKDLDTIYAAPYEGESTILHILEGFHKYKPKCEERPQYPVDIWLMFDIDTYDNVEYLHPRHNVLARDKWRRKHPENSGLIGIISIN